MDTRTPLKWTKQRKQAYSGQRKNTLFHYATNADGVSFTVHSLGGRSRPRIDAEAAGIKVRVRPVHGEVEIYDMADAIEACECFDLGAWTAAEIDGLERQQRGMRRQIDEAAAQIAALRRLAARAGDGLQQRKVRYLLDQTCEVIAQFVDTDPGRGMVAGYTISQGNISLGTTYAQGLPTAAPLEAEDTELALREYGVEAVPEAAHERLGIDWMEYPSGRQVGHCDGDRYQGSVCYLEINALEPTAAKGPHTHWVSVWEEFPNSDDDATNAIGEWEIGMPGDTSGDLQAQAAEKLDRALSNARRLTLGLPAAATDPATETVPADDLAP